MIVKHRKTQKGSALIITLLMITVIASVSFAVTALALSEFRKAANIQDSIIAYYAAESGLEHGLMEYRLWHDAEISKEVYEHAQGGSAGLSLPQDKIPTLDQGSPQTFRLTGTKTGETLPGFVPETSTKKGNSWYNLKMFYRGDSIGKVNSAGNPVVDLAKSPRVKRDSAAEYNIEGAKAIKFAWKPDEATASTPPAPLPPSTTRYFVELTFTVRDGSVCPNPVHQLYEIADNLNDPLILNPPLLTLTNCEYKSVRIKPWNMPYAQYSFVLYDKPSQTGTPLKVDQLKTSFESTGYSNGAKRTLQLNLSRTIGTIIESGDFLFLSGDKPLTF